ncbi:MAG: hypothetical protein M1489_06020 [Firmicutes bacterium]|nr:hypothetical protein [Bacillota bacterium]
MGDIVSYEEVPASQVPLAKRLAAMEMKSFCTADLGLPYLKIIWAQKCGHTRQYSGQLFRNYVEAFGIAYLAEKIIMLNIELLEYKVPHTAAHECRHFYQFKHMPDFPGNNDIEWDANRYAEQALKALHYWRCCQRSTAMSCTDKSLYIS